MKYKTYSEALSAACVDPSNFDMHIEVYEQGFRRRLLGLKVLCWGAIPVAVLSGLLCVAVFIVSAA